GADAPKRERGGSKRRPAIGAAKEAETARVAGPEGGGIRNIRRQASRDVGELRKGAPGRRGVLALPQLAAVVHGVEVARREVALHEKGNGRGHEARTARLPGPSGVAARGEVVAENAVEAPRIGGRDRQLGQVRSENVRPRRAAVGAASEPLPRIRVEDI